MNDYLEHICPDYRTVTQAVPGGAPIYLADTMWFEQGQWWMGEEDIVCPVRFCPFCGLELKSLANGLIDESEPGSGRPDVLPG